MLEQSFGVFFFLKKPKKSREDGLRYVYQKITINGDPKELSTKHLWHPSRWDVKAGRATGNKEDAKVLNTHLDALKLSCSIARTYLLNRGREITAQSIKDRLQGKTEERRGVLKMFQDHNDTIATLVEVGEYALGTLTKYKKAREHLSDFIKQRYHKDEFYLDELDYGFIADYERFLKVNKKCGINAVAKYISNFKKIILDAVTRGWIIKNPFIGFKSKRKDVVIVPIDQEELDRIQEKQFLTERLSLIKDVFLFSCYTGLAYVDAKKLSKSNIQKGIGGQLWININRTKTDSPTRLPLLPVALEIMNKYKDHPRCIELGTIMPVPTNQKVNEYLKEIATLCNIEKKLTFHIARHTFATTVTLNNGVPIESVSKMLGHSSVKQTQHYAKIQDHKVSHDMLTLTQKLNNNNPPSCYPLELKNTIEIKNYKTFMDRTASGT